MWTGRGKLDDNEDGDGDDGFPDKAKPSLASRMSFLYKAHGESAKTITSELLSRSDIY